MSFDPISLETISLDIGFSLDFCLQSLMTLIFCRLFGTNAILKSDMAKEGGVSQNPYRRSRDFLSPSGEQSVMAKFCVFWDFSEFS